jgi:hypothetical protein
MKILIATINDCHSGEAYWEGWTVRIPVNEETFNAVVDAKDDIYLADGFVNQLLDNLPEDAHDLTKGGDAQIQAWVPTEPRSYEFREMIWDELRYGTIYDAYCDEEITVDVTTLSMSIQGGDFEPGWCVPNHIVA